MKLKQVRMDIFMMLLFFSVLFAEKPGFAQDRKNGGEESEKISLNEEGAQEVLTGPGENAIMLPLKRALGIALENNLAIQIEKVSIPLSEEVVTERRARFDPLLFGEFISRRYEEQTSWALSGAPIYKENEQRGKFGLRKRFTVGMEAESYLQTSRTKNNSELEGLEPKYRDFFVLSLRQPLLQDFGTTVNTTDIRVAENDRTIREKGFTLQVMTTLDQAEQIYHDLSGAIETLRLREESLRLAQELLANNRKRFEAGITHIGEVQEAETAVASREEQVIAAQQVVKDVTHVLKNILQVKPDSFLYPSKLQTEGLLPPAEEIPSYEECFSRALDHRPDYAQKKIVLESRDIALKFNKNQLLPRLDLVGTFGLNGLSGKADEITFAGMTSKNPFGGGYGDSWENLVDGDGYEWSVGLTVEIPLGNRADRARYTQSKLYKEQSIMDLKNLEDHIDLEIKVALENIGSSRDRINVAERAVRLAEITLGQEEERMKRGLSDTFRILIFQTALIETKIRKVTALVDYQKALAQLYRSMGTNLQRHDMRVNYTDV